MYVDRILRLADMLEASMAPSATPDFGFNMTTWEMEGCLRDNTGHFCETTGCIAGWILHYAEREGWQHRKDAYGYATKSMDILGLEEQRHVDLFYAHCLSEDGSRLYCDDVTPVHAAKVLRHLAKTGVVEWDMRKHVTAPVEHQSITKGIDTAAEVVTEFA